MWLLASRIMAHATTSFSRVGGTFLRCRHMSEMVRLTKRMSELNICSRREADRWIRDGLVSVGGKVAEVGEKVQASLSVHSIEVVSVGDHYESSLSFQDGIASTDLTMAVVLNKPPGYVSGQADHGHQPAIRLLTRDRLWGSTNNDVKLPGNSWKHFAPAGRLDLDSAGLLIFAWSGVIAKKLIHIDSSVEKEYVVGVAPAIQEMKRELELDENFVLPKPCLDLTQITQGGGFLLGERQPLIPCRARWLKEGSILQLILTEGKKQHIRRACRQLLGYHVVSLERIRIGPVQIADLPQGHWRPLRKDEIEQIMAS